MGGAMLIVGAGGFVGRHLAPCATTAGVSVVAAGRVATVQAPACDLRDPALIARCLQEVQPELIVNLAGAPSVAASWEWPAESFAANATSCLNLLEAVSRNAPDAHLVCVSSAAVYGRPGPEQLPLSEEAPLSPVSPYGAAKASMEMLCGQYARSRGVRIAVIRPFNLLGPGQAAFNAASGFAREIAEAEAAGRTTLQLRLGNPAAARDLLDVRDAARALTEISRLRLEGTYNLCSGEAVSVSDLAEGIAALSPLEIELRVDPALARPADPPLLVGDPARLREAIGLVPTIALEQSLADSLEWWRGQVPTA